MVKVKLIIIIAAATWSSLTFDVLPVEAGILYKISKIVYSPVSAFKATLYEIAVAFYLNAVYKG